jgi:hypothetical protein
MGNNQTLGEVSIDVAFVNLCFEDIQMVDVRISISVVHGSDLELPKKGGLGLCSTVRALYRIESKGTACKAGNFQLTDRLFRHSVLGSESVVVWSVCGLSQCSL